MKVGLVLALAILLSVGCQSTAWELSTSLDKGVAGYEGEVTPFTIPYRLRYEASPEVTQTIAATITKLDGTTKRISMLVRVKISAIGEQRLWEFKFDEVADDGQRWRSSTVPLMTARGLSSSIGPLEDIDLAFPAFQQQGAEIPDQNSDMYQDLTSVFRDSSVVLPKDPVGMNDEIVSGDEMLERILAPLKLSLPAQKHIRRNTLSARIVGETYDNAVHCLVVLLDGELEMEGPKGSFTLGWRGHWLIDSGTGLIRRMAVAVDLPVRHSGEIKRAAIFSTLQSR